MFQRSFHGVHHKPTKLFSNRKETRRSSHTNLTFPDRTQGVSTPEKGHSTQTFGNSWFSAPGVVLLRLFFQASSFQLDCRHSKHVAIRSRRIAGELTASERFSEHVLKPRRLAREQRTLSPFSHLNRKVSTSAFFEEVTASPDKYGAYQVTSVSWVKALASHMSHEFIQFVIENKATGHRMRLITDRQETGDWVITTGSGIEAAAKFSWSALSPYKDRHNLPLPLVSLRLNDANARPSLIEIAKLIIEISHTAPVYNPLREHCWWYSEALFEAVRKRYSAHNIQEWPWAKYRYSFVLCNSWVKRKTLAAEAEEHGEDRPTSELVLDQLVKNIEQKLWLNFNLPGLQPKAMTENSPSPSA
ncbi:hypothetical protein DV736_g3324, partial [Chaetothyriales sp. CBS 134916]